MDESLRHWTVDEDGNAVRTVEYVQGSKKYHRRSKYGFDDYFGGMDGITTY